MVLKSGGIELRNIRREDTVLIVNWRNKDNVRKNFLYQKPFTEEGHIKWMQEKVETGKVAQFIIYSRKIGKPVGSVFLRDIDYESRKAEYGIFIGEDCARGLGIGTWAARMIVDYGFNELRLHKIFLRVLADNEAAIRSYEKAGFCKEGYFRDEVMIGDRYRDIIFMAVFNPKEEIR